MRQVLACAAALYRMPLLLVQGGAPATSHPQRLGHVLAEFGELAAAARAGGGCRDHHAFAGQVCGKGCPHRLFAGEAGNDGPILTGLGPDGEFVFGRAGFELLELQLELVDKLAPPRSADCPKRSRFNLAMTSFRCVDHGLGIGDHRPRRKGGSHNGALLPLTPRPSPFAAGNNLQTGHLDTSCTGASTTACTGADIRP